MKFILHLGGRAGLAAALSGAVLLWTGCNTFDGGAAAGPGGGAAATKSPAAPAPPSTKSDLLHKGDLVTITFSGVENPPLKHEERIKDDGAISLALIGSVLAADKTSGQLQKEIQDLYVPRFFRRLTVNVNGEARFFFVAGQVNRPDRQQYLGETTVLKAIAAAGDFNDFAKKKAVQLTRSNGEKFTVNCVKAQKDPKLDLPVYPGDKIFVDRRWW